MTPGYDQPLYILAFDHRTSFTTKLFGIQGTPAMLTDSGMMIPGYQSPQELKQVLDNQKRGG